jgi:hypothetical protein
MKASDIALLRKVAKILTTIANDQAGKAVSAQAVPAKPRSVINSELDKKIKIGFWSAKGEEIPVDKDWRKKNQRAFELVLLFLDSPTNKTRYKGWANCKICKKEIGSDDLHKENFIYPSGYVHYLTCHDVVPDQRIVDAAVSVAKKSLIKLWEKNGR